MRFLKALPTLFLLLAVLAGGVSAEPYSNEHYHFSVELPPGWQAEPFDGPPPQIQLHPPGEHGVSVVHEAMRRDDPLAALAMVCKMLGLGRPTPTKFAGMAAARATGGSGETWMMVTGKAHSWTLIFKPGLKDQAGLLQSFRELP